MTRPALFVILSALALSPLPPAAAQDLLWVRQSGTVAGDTSYRVAADGAGNAYITGATDGSLGGPNVGGSDVFLSKYDASGTLVWTKQFGSPAGEYGLGVAADGKGNVFVAGYTYGTLSGLNAGSSDVFLAKYDASGTQLWLRQTGTPLFDDTLGVAVDGIGNAYLVGDTNGNLGGTNAGNTDVFVSKYNESGVPLWTRQIGTVASDFGRNIAVDKAGNAYITGYTAGNLGGTNVGSVDIFLAKFDASGTQLWIRQVGTSVPDIAFGVAVDSAGNAYVAGETEGTLDGTSDGNTDAFLAKYDASGTLLWIRQIGTTEIDGASGVALDGSGNAYVAGVTQSSLGGPNAGDFDTFLAKLDASGNRLWTRQIGTAPADRAYGVAADGAGNAYVAGGTLGSLGGPNAGLYDYFLAKFGPSLCPADFNHDGFVTGDDFDSFSLAFIAGDLSADFDHNGFVTGDDFDAYAAAFENGC